VSAMQLVMAAGGPVDGLDGKPDRRSGAPVSRAPSDLGAAAPGEVDLLTAVAHELRDRLGGLTTSSEMLAEDLERLDAREIRRMVASVHRGALQLQSTVENLLCAAAIRAGRFRVHPRPLRLTDVAEEVRVVVEPLLAEKAQRLRLSARGPVPEILGDPRRIGQVLVNLLGNASKFGGPGTPIDLTVAARGDYVRVSVADRGPGLPPARAEELFAPFHRAAEAARPGGGGIGLGLAIVDQILVAHGGRVGAEDRRGGGAHFWFDLPIARPARETSGEGR
jgi:two-component system, OmpR family, sensor histidine kinase KdpD